ncbi:MAG TPA: hypothetical protein VNA25_22870 [Phycisphaerae bacterium]|nr:hypothetical protein [Phycisphaerae bacterium]
MSNRPEMPGSNPMGLSQALWAGMPLDQIIAFRDPSVGFGFFDNFTDFGGILSTSDGQYHSEGNTYRSYQTASTFITNVAFTPTPASVAPTAIGAIKFSPTAGIVDNDIMTLVRGGNIATPYGGFPFSMIPGMSRDLVFEARFKTSSVTASIGNFFVGLGGAAGVDTASADCPIAADVLATTLSMIGFGRFGTSTTALGLFYERASGTVATKAAVGTLVADTYIKAGFKWDGAMQTLTPWIDGVEQPASRCSKAIAAATPWPNDYMTAIASARQIDGTTASELTMDWWACAQKAYG